ncbi:hypothetical protein SS1G_04379 [Sclerotinia sclerotiorum 1980 UF-70]|uniref:Uncharacterized protein n=1 Tax=Sclerotinia sclerotiorum (strain ATCC 18683 / 1980 / Ss-1) TaxID=665079 RepID=A7EGD8_SCLS1|nr:hypothetical protein SS1G_04379 [Sclerotinia sclerotiorum 1980 UF-70]EDO01904.1 hypothetical protein SS1G_04379 [Sclerotinia sclerotiorum 1980 UF-70]
MILAPKIFSSTIWYILDLGLGGPEVDTIKIWEVEGLDNDAMLTIKRRPCNLESASETTS